MNDLNIFQKVALVCLGGLLLGILLCSIAVLTGFIVDLAARRRPFRRWAKFEQPPAPATWYGWQFIPGRPPVEIYVLTQAIPGHPVESSVSRQTLEDNGFYVPPAPRPATWPVSPAGPRSLRRDPPRM